MQIFSEEQAEGFSFDVLDATKLIPEELVPVTRSSSKSPRWHRLLNFFNITATFQDGVPPFTVRSSQPMCRYPLSAPVAAK